MVTRLFKSAFSSARDISLRHSKFNELRENCKPAKNFTILLSDDEEILSLMVLEVSNTAVLSGNFVTNGWSKNVLFVVIKEYFKIILFDYQRFNNLPFIKAVK